MNIESLYSQYYTAYLQNDLIVSLDPSNYYKDIEISLSEFKVQVDESRFPFNSGNISILPVHEE